MPPLNMHLLIGERLFPLLQAEQGGKARLAPFLAGNLIVDANSFTALPRPATHLVSREEEPRGLGYRRFIATAPRLLRRPPAALTPEEMALASGYLAHLAADAFWKATLHRLYRRLGIASWRDLPFPADVFLTEISVLCTPRFADFPRLARAMQRYRRLPPLFAHVPHAALQRTWQIGRTVLQRPYRRSSYYAMLALKGLPQAEIEAVEAAHRRYGDEARRAILGWGDLDAWLAHIVTNAEAVLREWWQSLAADRTATAKRD